MRTITNLYFTTENAIISQKGVIQNTCKVFIPVEKIYLIAESLAIMYFNYQSIISNGLKDKHQHFEHIISDNQIIEIDEGITNDKNNKANIFSIYDISGERRFAEISNNIVFFEMDSAFTLSEFLKIKKTHTWENSNK